MRDTVTIDIRSVWAEVEAIPDKGYLGAKKAMTSDEEWILWVSYNRKSTKVLGQAMHYGPDRLKREYERLEKQGGPKGKRPEWMT